jgi:hypothetical protein
MDLARTKHTSFQVAGLEYSTQGPSGSQELLMRVATERYRFKIQIVLEKHKP